MKRIIFEQKAYDDFCDWGIYDKARYLWNGSIKQ